MSAPTFINLPPAPADPVTPSEAPGTPNSTTTSMSELSTVAIKDGHRGHPHHHQTHDRLAPVSSLETERADRISRLPGLERLSNVRQSSNASLPPGASASHPQGYFDAPIPPSNAKERSTVGSASATGSIGGHTTWASGSDKGDATDKMSEDMDEASSDGAMSDEGNGSLVDFGEGAGSTVSGPVSSFNTAFPRTSHRQSYNSKASDAPAYIRAEQTRDPRSIDGMTYDNGAVDRIYGTPPAARGERVSGYSDPDDVAMTGHVDH